jgi:hypothetical protein
MKHERSAGTQTMPDAVTPLPTIDCTVLRQADYKSGEWLMSDRHDRVGLFCEVTDTLIEMMEETANLNVPLLMLVRESRLGEHGAMYAKPLSRGVYSFGGNWLWSDDARFPSPQPIPIHDVPQP